MTTHRRTQSEKAQCHFISNTHWDREWRYSMQRIRYMLVECLDMLFDIFEKEPNFASFHLDSQTVPIQDYLEVRPEMEETVRKYVTAKKLLIGPWFCLPDEFCVHEQGVGVYIGEQAPVIVSGFHIELEPDLPALDQSTVEGRGRQTVGLDPAGGMDCFWRVHSDIADRFDPVSETHPDRITVDHPIDDPDNRCLHQD